MITHNKSTQTIGLAGLQPPHPFANFVWMAILAVAAISGSLALSCITPFAALAVALAGTVRLRAALTTITAVWLTNQMVGFACLGYPRTPGTFIWGIVIGGAALLATVVASAVIKRASSRGTATRLGLALLLSFAGYEATLLIASLFLGGLETFAPRIIAQLGVTNLAWFVGLIALNELVAWLCRPWLGIAPRLASAR
jgi:hypothetical protein